MLLAIKKPITDRPVECEAFYSTVQEGSSQETPSVSTKVEMGKTRRSEQKNTRDNNICVGQTRKLFPPDRQLFMLWASNIYELFV